MYGSEHLSFYKAHLKILPYQIDSKVKIKNEITVSADDWYQSSSNHVCVVCALKIF